MAILPISLLLFVLFSILLLVVPQLASSRKIPRQVSLKTIVVVRMRLALFVFVFPMLSSAFLAPLIPQTRSRTTFLARPAKKASDETEDSKPGSNPAKKAALDGVLQQIERSYGRGSVVRLGDAEGMIVDSIGTGALTLGESSLCRVCGHCANEGAPPYFYPILIQTLRWEVAIQRVEWWRFTAQKVVERRLSLCTQLQNLKKMVALLPLLMQNMLWILHMQQDWVWT
jgi:hypothetical protein